MAIPLVPHSLKAIQHYVKTATDHAKRDPVVAYYSLLYATQKGMEIDKKSQEAKSFLLAVMDTLEKWKEGNHDNEAMHNDIVAQAHIENYALHLFKVTDDKDRAGQTGKPIVKAFYTAGLLFDVLTTFGELSDDVERSRKYAKWKAAYIHKCLKDGVTPIPGPCPEDDEFAEFGETSTGATGGNVGFEGYNQPQQPYQPQQPQYPTPAPRTNLPSPSNAHQVPTPHAPPTTPSEPPANALPQMGGGAQAGRIQAPAVAGGVKLSPQDYQKAMKLCKYAGSALQYEDSKTAIENLVKALNLLTTGKD